MATKIHCLWAPAGDAFYRQYHDEEWGVPEYDDRALFEKLLLDGFQAGLSWRTILYKRDNFRKAFNGFEPEKIARYTPKKIERLMTDTGIIRSKTKINAAIGNAKVWLDLMETRDEGFSGYLWDFVNGKPILQGRAGQITGKRSYVERIKAPRLQVLRACDRLCFHAGGWHD